MYKLEIEKDICEEKEKEVISYEHEKTIMKSFNVSGDGKYSYQLNDIFQGEVPHKLVLGMVDAEAFNGNVTKNPYNFEHCNISEVCAEVDGIPISTKRYTPNFGNRADTCPIYLALFDDNPRLDLTRDEFTHGYTLFSFTLPKGGEKEMKTLQRGNCAVSLRFNKPLKKNMVLVIMAKFPAALKVNNDNKQVEL